MVDRLHMPFFYVAGNHDIYDELSVENVRVFHYVIANFCSYQQTIVSKWLAKTTIIMVERPNSYSIRIVPFIAIKRCRKKIKMTFYKLGPYNPRRFSDMGMCDIAKFIAKSEVKARVIIIVWNKSAATLGRRLYGDPTVKSARSG